MNDQEFRIGYLPCIPMSQPSPATPVLNCSAERYRPAGSRHKAFSQDRVEMSAQHGDKLWQRETPGARNRFRFGPRHCCENDAGELSR